MYFPLTSWNWYGTLKSRLCYIKIYFRFLGSIPIWKIERFHISTSSLRYRAKALRWVPPLITQYLQNSAECGGRRVLMRTECLNSRFPCPICHALLCACYGRIQREAKKCSCLKYLFHFQVYLQSFFINLLSLKFKLQS